MSTETTVARTIANLRATVAHHEKAYRIHLQPEISDDAFDALKSELTRLTAMYPQFAEPSDAAIGNDTQGLRPMRQHRYPMLSLDSTRNPEALLAWMREMAPVLPTDTGLHWAVSHKLDGMALDLTYENGVLTQAVQRGDGIEGEDVLINALVVQGIPHRLDPAMQPPSRLHVRGEVIVQRGHFDNYNAKAEEDGRKTYSGPRAMAAAAMRYLRPALTRMLHPSFIAYRVIGLEVEHQQGVLAWLPLNGFSPVKTRVVSTPEEALAVVQEIQQERPSLPYDTDGAVIGIAHLNVCDALGDKTTAPRWAKVFKYPSLEGYSKVRDIVFQVGRTGVITPVLKVDPVAIGDIEVRSITLHNAGYVERYQLALGDTVVIRRANDVGPQFVKAIPAENPGPPIPVVTHCPSCQTAIIACSNPAMRRCPNVTGCPAQLQATLLQFVGKRGLDIEGFGQSRIERLIASGTVKRPADFFRLQASDLMRLFGIGRGFADDLIVRIATAKWTTLPRFLTALGIEGVGISTATALAHAYDYNLEALLNTDAATLAKVPGIGEVRVPSLMAYFRTAREAIQELIDQGVEWPSHLPMPSETPGPMEGLRLMVTGRVPGHQGEGLTRDEVNNALRGYGAVIVTQVTSALNALLIGERPSQSKVAAAKTLDIPVLTVPEYLASFNLPNL